MRITLSCFPYFILSAPALLALLFLLAHFAMFQFFMSNPKMWQNQRQMPPPSEMFAVFQWFYLVAAAWLIASGVLNVMSGLFLRARTHRVFSLVVGAINCLHVPIGTALGVFTIVVLMRDSVRELYEAEHVLR